MLHHDMQRDTNCRRTNMLVDIYMRAFNIGKNFLSSENFNYVEGKILKVFQIF
mgnify:CR=1 FL=1